MDSFYFIYKKNRRDARSNEIILFQKIWKFGDDFSFRFPLFCLCLCLSFSLYLFFSHLHSHLLSLSLSMPLFSSSCLMPRLDNVFSESLSHSTMIHNEFKNKKERNNKKKNNNNYY